MMRMRRRRRMTIVMPIMMWTAMIIKMQKKGQARMFMRIMKMKMKMLLKKCMIGALDTVNDKWDFH